MTNKNHSELHGMEENTTSCLLFFNFNVFSFCQGTKLWIIMEYLGGGSALDLMKAGSLEEVNTFPQVGEKIALWRGGWPLWD